MSKHWQFRGLLSGYFASLLMLFTWLAAFAAIWAGTSGSLHRLADNGLAELAKDYPFAAIWIHLLSGGTFALVYARWVEPRLSGPGWWRGWLFAMGPLLVSLLIFFPLVGAGFAGLGLGAGYYPILGNFVLHSVYGLSLGWLYERSFALLNSGAAARGLLLGTGAGVLIGEIARHIFGPGAPGLSDGWMPVTGLLLGSALGCAWGFLRFEQVAVEA